MNTKELVNQLISQRDSSLAKQMEKYMRNQFTFLGIQSLKRRELTKPLLNEIKKHSSVDWRFVDYLWNQPYREFQYTACDYLVLMKNKLTPDDIPYLKKLALNKSWWDTVDILDKVIGTIGLTYPVVNELMLDWSTNNNIWLRRIAINHQRHRKDLTDRVLLEQIITNNFGTDEFFVNKAIGWILRDYSKTDPAWVRQFIIKYEKEMHPLSIREGSKYLDRFD